MTTTETLCAGPPEAEWARLLDEDLMAYMPNIEPPVTPPQVPGHGKSSVSNLARFRTILADPPWNYQTWGKMGRKRSPENHYPVLSLADIAALPVGDVAAKDCVLLLWTTWPLLAEGSMQAILDGWGFQGKTGFPWLKLSKQMLPRLGTGYHARACTEPLLIATKGKPPCPEPWERLGGVLFSKLGAHSAKPDTIYERAELYDGPYLEVFARPDGDLFPPRPNWTQIGMEITGRDIREDLRLLAETEK